MIGHSVTWKLKDRDDAAKADAVAAIAGVLEPLVGVVPGLVSLQIRENVAYPEGNWDVVLLSQFESIEALEGYLVHPAHVAAAATPRSLAAERASIDYEL